MSPSTNKHKSGRKPDPPKKDTATFECPLILSEPVLKPGDTITYPSLPALPTTAKSIASSAKLDDRSLSSGDRVSPKHQHHHDAEQNKGSLRQGAANSQWNNALPEKTGSNEADFQNKSTLESTATNTKHEYRPRYASVDVGHAKPLIGASELALASPRRSSTFDQRKATNPVSEQHRSTTFTAKDSLAASSAGGGHSYSQTAAQFKPSALLDSFHQTRERRSSQENVLKHLSSLTFSHTTHANSPAAATVLRPSAPPAAANNKNEKLRLNHHELAAARRANTSFKRKHNPHTRLNRPRSSHLKASRLASTNKSAVSFDATDDSSKSIKSKTSIDSAQTEFFMQQQQAAGSRGKLRKTPKESTGGVSPSPSISGRSQQQFDLQEQQLQQIRQRSALDSSSRPAGANSASFHTQSDSLSSSEISPTFTTSSQSQGPGQQQQQRALVGAAAQANDREPQRIPQEPPPKTQTTQPLRPQDPPPKAHKRSLLSFSRSKSSSTSSAANSQSQSSSAKQSSLPFRQLSQRKSPTLPQLTSSPTSVTSTSPTTPAPGNVQPSTLRQRLPSDTPGNSPSTSLTFSRSPLAAPDEPLENTLNRDQLTLRQKDRHSIALLYNEATNSFQNARDNLIDHDWDAVSAQSSELNLPLRGTNNTTHSPSRQDDDRRVVDRAHSSLAFYDTTRQENSTAYHSASTSPTTTISTIDGAPPSSRYNSKLYSQESSISVPSLNPPSPPNARMRERDDPYSSQRATLRPPGSKSSVSDDSGLGNANNGSAPLIHQSLLQRDGSYGSSLSVNQSNQPNYRNTPQASPMVSSHNVADADRRTPPLSNSRGAGGEDVHNLDQAGLIAKYEELNEKYKKVKRFYWEKENLVSPLQSQIINLQNQVTNLQNTLAHQRLAVSRTSFDDQEYGQRFTRLEGAINNLAFNLRKEWRQVPARLAQSVNKEAASSATKEMTAVGRAWISTLLVDNLFDRYFHPGLEPELSRQLKNIERNLRHHSAPATNDEEHEALLARISNWRLATLDGLSEYLSKERAENNKRSMIDLLIHELVASLRSFMKDPSSDNGLTMGVAGIVELAINIAWHIPSESRDIHIKYHTPESPLDDTMRIELVLPPLTNPGADSSSNDHDTHSHAQGRNRSDTEDSTLTDSDADGKRKNNNFSKTLTKKTGGNGASNASNVSNTSGIGIAVSGEPQEGSEPRLIRFAAFMTVEIRGKPSLLKTPVYI